MSEVIRILDSGRELVAKDQIEDLVGIWLRLSSAVAFLALFRPALRINNR